MIPPTNYLLLPFVAQVLARLINTVARDSSNFLDLFDGLSLSCLEMTGLENARISVMSTS
jgi:hypothetical protein